MNRNNITFIILVIVLASLLYGCQSDQEYIDTNDPYANDYNNHPSMMGPKNGHGHHSRQGHGHEFDHQGHHGNRHHGGHWDMPLSSSTGKNELNIPPILESDNETTEDIYYTVEAQQGKTEIFSGHKTTTLGYNGSFLGPVLKAKEGQKVHITLKNSLTEETTVHWHGLIVDGVADGGPHDPIKPGETKEISFRVQQDDATLWFHPHPLGKTAQQVYEGLAGLLYIESDPSEDFVYGENDFPLIFQDRLFTEDYELDYGYAYHMDGVTGDTMLVNGTVNPQLTVNKEKVRLRLLNGSNKRNYTFKLNNGQSFQQIASDGGMLDEPVERNSVSLTPAERAEIVVDFSNVEPGEKIELVMDEVTVLPFQVQDQVEKKDPSVDDFKQSENIIPIEDLPTDVSKEVTLFGRGHHVTINGQKFDKDRIDFTQKVGETEIWEVYNKPDMMGGVDHPFHIHGTQFQIVSINGEEPPAELQGLKDTIAMAPGDRVKLAVTFDKPGLYMYHCHILEHEDHGMMGQVLVE